MRIRLVLAILLASCGSTVAAPQTTTPPGTPTPIPWIADVARPTPMPTPTIPPPPIGIRACAAAEISAAIPRGQGAGGWAIRNVIVANAGTSACVITGPISVALLDGAATIIARTGTAPLSWSAPGWAVLEPGRAPAVEPYAGQARVMLQTYGDCGHATMTAIVITFAAPTGTVRIPVEPQPVSGRCDVPGEPLVLGWGAVGPMQPPAYPTPPAPPLAYRIEAPAVAFAGEPLHYVVWIRNTATTAYRWDDGCPLYLEWLGGHEVTPTDLPGPVSKPSPDRLYAGFAKEFHPLNCGPAGTLAPDAEVAFEMSIDVPRDALGPDTLRWKIAAPLAADPATAWVDFPPPQR